MITSCAAYIICAITGFGQTMWTQHLPILAGPGLMTEPMSQLAPHSCQRLHAQRHPHQVSEGVSIAGIWLLTNTRE